MNWILVMIFTINGEQSHAVVSDNASFEVCASVGQFLVDKFEQTGQSASFKCPNETEINEVLAQLSAPADDLECSGQTNIQVAVEDGWINAEQGRDETRQALRLAVWGPILVASSCEQLDEDPEPEAIVVSRLEGTGPYYQLQIIDFRSDGIATWSYWSSGEPRVQDRYVQLGVLDNGYQGAGSPITYTSYRMTNDGLVPEPADCARLWELTSILEQLRTSYTDRHPDIVRLRERINDLKRLLGAVSSASTLQEICPEFTARTLTAPIPTPSDVIANPEVVGTNWLLMVTSADDDNLSGSFISDHDSYDECIASGQILVEELQQAGRLASFTCPSDVDIQEWLKPFID